MKTTNLVLIFDKDRKKSQSKLYGSFKLSDTRRSQGMQMKDSSSSNLFRSNQSPVKNNDFLQGRSLMSTSTDGFFNQSQGKSLQQNRKSLHERTVIKLLGLNMEAICSKPGHEKNKIMFICKNIECQAINRLGCAHCFLYEHTNHPQDKLDLQEYCLKLDQKILELQDIINKFKYMKQNSQKLEIMIKEEFSTLKMDILSYINRIEKQVIKEINDQFPEINHYSQYDELINELSKKNIFDLSSLEQKSSLLILNGSAFENLKNINSQQTQQLQEKEQQIIKIWNNFNTFLQCDVFQALKQNSKICFIKTSKVDEIQQRLTQLKDKNNIIEQEQKTLTQILNDYNKQQMQDQIRISLQKEEELKKQKNQQKLLKEQEKRKNEKDKLIKNFPYQIFEKSCSHFPNQNTIPIWQCCNRAFPCQICHGTSYHPPQVQQPSMRYCMKCLEIYQVSFSTTQAVNCLQCIDK